MLAVADRTLLPSTAAVRAIEVAALVADLAVSAEVGDEHDVGIRGMNADFRDRIRVGKADMRPRLARVARFVDAVPGHDVAAYARLAHADEHDVRIRLRNGDGADRRALDLTVGHRRPCAGAVDRFPEPAADRAEIRLLRTSLDARHRNRSAAAPGSDAAPVEGLQHGRVDSRF